MHAADERFRPVPKPGRSLRRSFPDWAQYTPIYDTTHFPLAGMAVLITEDLVSRKWITELVSAEETPQVEVAFIQALAAEGLLEVAEARTSDDVVIGPQDRPVLLAVSDNGPQMRSGSTAELADVG